MTPEEQFRKDGTRRAELQGLLASETFRLAQQIVMSKSFAKDAGSSDDALASVRILSKRTGREEAFVDLAVLAEPWPEIQTEPEHDYASDQESQ